MVFDVYGMMIIDLASFQLLHECGAVHLRARKYGAAVLVESGPTHDSIKHFRLRRDTVNVWCLDMADHRGRWEKSPLSRRSR